MINLLKNNLIFGLAVLALVILMGIGIWIKKKKKSGKEDGSDIYPLW